MAQVLHPNFFPFCISNSSGKSSGASTAKAPLLLAMELYWKVKRWAASGMTFTPEPGYGPVENISQDAFQWENVEVGDERDLVCFPKYRLVPVNPNATFQQDGDIFGVDSQSLSFFTRVFGGNRAWKTNAEEEITETTQIEFEANVLFRLSDINSIYSTLEGSGEQVNCTFRLDGGDIVIPIYSNAENPTSIIIGAVDYWLYD